MRRKNVLVIFLSSKRWVAKHICSECRRKKWFVSFVNDLSRNIDKAGIVERKASSGRPWSVERNDISLVFLSGYAVKRTMVLAIRSPRIREVICFICCRALLCSIYILRACVRFAIVYRALSWYRDCDKKYI